MDKEQLQNELDCSEAAGRWLLEHIDRIMPQLANLAQMVDPDLTAEYMRDWYDCRAIFKGEKDDGNSE